MATPRITVTPLRDDERELEREARRDAIVQALMRQAGMMPDSGPGDGLEAFNDPMVYNVDRGTSANDAAISGFAGGQGTQSLSDMLGIGDPNASFNDGKPTESIGDRSDAATASAMAALGAMTTSQASMVGDPVDPADPDGTGRGYSDVSVFGRTGDDSSQASQDKQAADKAALAEAAAGRGGYAATTPGFFGMPSSGNLFEGSTFDHFAGGKVTPFAGRDDEGNPVDTSEMGGPFGGRGGKDREGNEIPSTGYVTTQSFVSPLPGYPTEPIDRAPLGPPAGARTATPSTAPPSGGRTASPGSAPGGRGGGAVTAPGDTGAISGMGAGGAAVSFGGPGDTPGGYAGGFGNTGGFGSGYAGSSEMGNTQGAQGFTTGGFSSGYSAGYSTGFNEGMTAAMSGGNEGVGGGGGGAEGGGGASSGGGGGSDPGGSPGGVG